MTTDHDGRRGAASHGAGARRLLSQGVDVSIKAAKAACRRRYSRPAQLQRAALGLAASWCCDACWRPQEPNARCLLTLAGNQQKF